MCAKTVIKGALVGGIVIFLWGMVSWMVLPFHMNSVTPFEKPETLIPAVQEQAIKGPGVYAGPCPMKNPEQIKTLPHTFVVVGQPSPQGFSMAPMMVTEFATNVVVAGFLTCLLMGLSVSGVKQSLHYGAKIGALVAIAAVVPQWNWWQFPVAFLGPIALDYIVGISLAAVVLSRFVLPRPVATATAA